jgi:hypothetical protein
VLIDAAEKFDVAALTQIFGHDVEDVIFSGEYAQDRKHAADFVAESHEKNSVSLDPNGGARAFLLVGNEDWPFPVPIVKRGARWAFDTKAGRQELLYRRIGANELDAIEICHGYVEAQHEYALQREGFEVNQYAQRIISTPGARRVASRTPMAPGGPIGEKIARAIEEGYTSCSNNHDTFLRRKSQNGGATGPNGFGVSGTDWVLPWWRRWPNTASPSKTFIVSHDGVVYEKDLGSKSLDGFQKLELFNPTNLDSGSKKGKPHGRRYHFSSGNWELQFD